MEPMKMHYVIVHCVQKLFQKYLRLMHNITSHHLNHSCNGPWSPSTGTDHWSAYWIIHPLPA